MSATPDRVVQDGAQASRIAVAAFNSAGQAVAVSVHLATFVNNFPQSFGTLSAQDIVTGTDANNPVVVTYVPPASTSGSDVIVTIVASAVGRDGANGSSQNQVSVNVAPATTLSPNAPVASFTAAPTAPATSLGAGSPIVFDASSSCGTALLSGGVCPGASSIVSVIWSFGDSTGASGMTVSHIYGVSKTYVVTLTVTNDRGISTSATQNVVVMPSVAPKAEFVVSPTTIKVGVNTAFFDGSQSTSGGTGRAIVRYDWNFGDGVTTSTTTPNTSHLYTSANTWKATLTVTNDLGQTNTVQHDVAVTP